MSREDTPIQVVVRVFVRRTGFEVFRVVVPAIFVDVMNVQVRPEIVYFAVRVCGEPVEVQVTVMSGVGIPHSNTRIVIEVELYTG
ncbi:hypothetical protein NDI85_01330 [Halomicroarcula sp. S1AR25-4]|nr:hypothetical protein [Halomicroarcula sp. S1AR25-4]MDS0276444.1 hypothetical protein [Halomicroarcula sp. S1AR25-4]